MKFRDKLQEKLPSVTAPKALKRFLNQINTSGQSEKSPVLKTVSQSELEDVTLLALSAGKSVVVSHDWF